MAKKTETKIDKIEREYIIPLREKCRPVARYRKTPKAVKTIKEFLVRHMKIYDRDLRKIKIDSYLNEYLWGRGIKHPVHKIKVKAIKEGDIVRVELVDYPASLKFKKLRQEKLEKKAGEAGKKKKAEKKAEEKPKVTLKGIPKGHDASEEKTEEDVKEEKEKKASVVEAGKELEKSAAKQMKHRAGGKIREPKHLQRVALQK